MPLWLDLLRTPMAAPETRALRDLRLVWLALCVASALAVGGFHQLHVALGRPPPCPPRRRRGARALGRGVQRARNHAADAVWRDRAGDADDAVSEAESGADRLVEGEA